MPIRLNRIFDQGQPLGHIVNLFRPLFPVSGKWNLVNDYTDYEHISASFYEIGVVRSYQPFDFRIL